MRVGPTIGSVCQTQQTLQPPTRTSRAGLGGQDWAGLGGAWRGLNNIPRHTITARRTRGEGGSTYGEPLVAKSPELGRIPTRRPSMSGDLGSVVVSANCAQLRVWEVGWGHAPLDRCGVLAGGHPLVCTTDPLMSPLLPSFIYSLSYLSLKR